MTVKYNLIAFSSSYWFNLELTVIKAVLTELAVVSKLGNPLSANPTKWSNTLKPFVGNLPTNLLSVFGDFVILALKGWMIQTDSHWYEARNVHCDNEVVETFQSWRFRKNIFTYSTKFMFLGCLCKERFKCRCDCWPSNIN